MTVALRSQRWAAPASVVLAALAMGWFHNRYIYPFIFHADTAAMQVLAHAILDEASLLPADFVYGNQLIMLRSSPFIAAALGLGWSGYDAFVVGSSVSVAAWALALYAILKAFTGARAAALALTLTMLIPMGFWDNDYVLGQQSHLSNMVMAIGITLCSWMWMRERSRAALAAALLLLFLMCAEAPSRAMLVLAPLALALLLRFPLRRAGRLVLMLAGAFVLGYLVNKGLQSVRPIAVDLFSTYKFRSITEMLETLAMLARELLMASSSVDLQHSKKVRAGGLIMVAACLVWLIGLFGFALLRARSVGALFITLGQPREEGSADPLREQFPAIVAVLGIVVGALAVSCLNPDTGRHFLWAYALLKLSFLIALYRFVTVTLGKPPAAFAWVALVMLAGSVWIATVAAHRGQLEQDGRARLQRPIEMQIARLAREHRIGHVFGPDFWRMHALNSTVPGVAAGVLELKGAELVQYDWLSRRSWFDRAAPVMYYLRDNPADQLIIAKLQHSGGRMVFSSSEGQIWIGAPVWDAGWRPMAWKGCELPTASGRKTADCQIEKSDPAQDEVLTFGPYVKLRSGTYDFELSYAGGGAPVRTAGRWDVVLQRGRGPKTLAEGTLQGSQERPANARGRFALGPADAMKALELRTYGQAGVGLRVHSLRIRRVQ